MSLVVAFVSCYMTGDELDLLHAYLGYAVLVLLGVRAIWGFVGTKYARFADFIYGWDRVRDYMLGLATMQPRHYVGHNPMGGWMVVALLVSLLLTCWTGLEAYGDQGHGPLANQSYGTLDVLGSGDREADDELWKELHETSANLALFLVLVHIFGVVVSSLLHRENLVRAM